jgi:SAM-dependent methyltransferase
MDEKTRSNQEAWDAVAKKHYENYHIDRLLAGEPLLNELVRAEVGEVAGRSLMHLLCHIGTDTLSWALLGAKVAGVDISPESIRYARQLAGQLGIEADFIVSDVMDLDGKVEPGYDIVFASTGVLCWISDIDRFARTARALLNPGGFFYLFDGHPFRNTFAEGEDGRVYIAADYFNQSADEFERFVDYTEKDLAFEQKSYEWSWTLGQVVTAFCQAGLRIEFLHEFPQYYYGGYPSYDVEPYKRELYPCTFSLKARAD